jgi:hypothetical protein
MSLFGTVANYGGRQPDNYQSVKQFVEGIGNQVIWIYKRLPSGLQVQTTADKIRPVYINTDLYINGSIYNPSDRILKDNINPIHNDTTCKILDLNPVQFVLKDDNQKKIHYGLIAQEIEQVFPELVKNSELGYKIVNYIELIPLLISKMKDMQKEIDELNLHR